MEERHLLSEPRPGLEKDSRLFSEFARPSASDVTILHSPAVAADRGALRAALEKSDHLPQHHPAAFFEDTNPNRPDRPARPRGTLLPGLGRGPEPGRFGVQPPGARGPGLPQHPRLPLFVDSRNTGAGKRPSARPVPGRPDEHLFVDGSRPIKGRNLIKTTFYYKKYISRWSG